MSASESPDVDEWRSIRQLIRNREFDAAVSQLEERLRSEPKNETALELLGMACFMAKKYEASREAFDRLTKADPTLVNAWVNLGAVCNRLGDHKKAVDALRRAVQRDRKCAEGYYNMGIAQKAMNLNTMAISAYKEAIKLRPDMVDAHLNLGNIYVEMKNLGLALQCYQNALKHDPNSVKAKQALEKAQSNQKFARKVENPFGRLVDVKTLAARQGDAAPRVIDATQRTEERELVQAVTKKIRPSAKGMVPILDESLPAQLHRLERIVLATDARLSSAEHMDVFTQTIHELLDQKQAVADGLNEIRAHLAALQRPR
jgi:tetratricopeptide (TPR) repeat protein